MNQPGCTWTIYLDGEPTDMQTSIGNASSGWASIFRQSTIVGVISAIGEKEHLVEVRANVMYGDSPGMCYTGWNSSFFLSVEKL